MAIFGNDDKSTQCKPGATVIAQGSYIIGGINTEGTVNVDGKFEGVILDADIITIGVKGEIIGDIKANHLIVSGLFDGKIDCNEVQILANGKVIGEIRYNRLVIDPEGSFEGMGYKKNSSLKSTYSEVNQKINNIVMSPKSITYDHNDEA
ncbi:MAG: polymer-forming cytoskeletal protein [Campylobacterota bacterium]|nr:polymer-forming cytoskeletal protein [Campylobacterota bacterium]